MDIKDQIIEKAKEYKKVKKLEEVYTQKQIKAFSKYASYSYLYALDVLKGRFRLGEKAISKDAEYSYIYALNILKGRFELGEKTISQDVEYSYLYACDVLKISS